MHQSCPITKFYAINANGFEVGICVTAEHSYDQYEILWFCIALISHANIQIFLLTCPEFPEY